MDHSVLPTDIRFLQPDPLGVTAGRNIYTYCEGDPVNCHDPYGLDAWLIGAPFRGTWAGERIDNAVDGMFELVGAVSGANADSDAAP